ncbi:platelet-activating factor acetyltransferase [Aureococcus anophagefferens]|nr:platelet-activating factor acetyltransferase [Aureococcus anophagefferens]
MVQDEAVLPADFVPEGAPSNLASPQLPTAPDTDAAACEGSDERKEAPAPACSPAAAAAALGDLGAAVEAHAASAAFLARRMRTLGRRGGAFGAILDARGADCARWSAALLRDFLPALALEKHGVAAGAPPARGDDAPRPRGDDPPRPCDGSRFGAGRRDSSQASLGGENYSGTLGDASFEAMEDLTAGAVDDDEGGDIMGFCLNGQEAILPESLLYWDYVMCFFILVYACFWDTYKCTFDYVDDWRWYDLAVDALFWVDMVVSSQTAYVSGGFCLVVDRGQVLRHYLGGWFVCDLVSTFPWDSLVSECTSVKKPVLQLLSLVRVLRVLRAPRIIHRITHDWAIHSVKIGFFLYMIFTLLVAHVMGCLFFLCPVVFKSGGGGRESWREKNGVDDMRPPKQYVYSIYWAFTTMTTLGYGDIVPSLLPELVLTILAEIVGAAAFALLVLHIQKLYDVILMEDVSSVAQRNQLTTYLDQMKVHKGLKTKIMRYISYAAHMHTYSSFDDDDPRFLGLTKALKLELRVEIFRPILLRNPIFNRVPGAAITAVARQVLSRPCSPGETFIDPGAYGDCVYIVLAGKVKVLDGTGAEFKVLRWSDVNNVVAITALLDDEIQASLAPLTEKLTAEACDHCSLAYIPRDAFRKGVLPVWPQGDTVLLEMLAEQAGVSGVPRSQTVWVGGVPEALSRRSRPRDGGRLALPDLGGIVLDVKIDENPTKSRALAILQTQRKASHRRRSSAVVGREAQVLGRDSCRRWPRASPEHAEDPSQRRSSLLAKGRDTTPLGGPSTPRRFFPWRASLAPVDTPPVETTFSVTSNGGA